MITVKVEYFDKACIKRSILAFWKLIELAGFNRNKPYNVISHGYCWAVAQYSDGRLIKKVSQ